MWVSRSRCRCADKWPTRVVTPYPLGLLSLFWVCLDPSSTCTVRYRDFPFAKKKEQSQ